MCMDTLTNPIMCIGVRGSRKKSHFSSLHFYYLSQGNLIFCIYICCHFYYMLIVWEGVGSFLKKCHYNLFIFSILYLFYSLYIYILYSYYLLSLFPIYIFLCTSIYEYFSFLLFFAPRGLFVFIFIYLLSFISIYTHPYISFLFSFFCAVLPYFLSARYKPISDCFSFNTYKIWAK